MRRVLIAVSLLVLLAAPAVTAPASTSATGAKLVVWSTDQHPLSCLDWVLSASATHNGVRVPATFTIRLGRYDAATGRTSRPKTVVVRSPSGLYRSGREPLFGAQDGDVRIYQVTAKTAYGTTSQIYRIWPTNVIAAGEGNGVLKWPTFDVPCEATFDWTHSGSFFSASSLADGSPSFIVSSTRHSGYSVMDPGTYELDIAATGDWTFTVTAP